MAKKKTYIYVDGFNLYYGSLKGTDYKWLNLEMLCQNILPKDNIVQIRYFTALVSGRPDDLSIPLRQKIYLRALATVPQISIHLGHYLTTVRWLPLASPPMNGPTKVKVIRTEEKGTDVNLATHLLVDAFHDRYDTAVVISNDSDLTEPIRVVTQEFKKQIGIINPQRNNPLASQLGQIATFRKRVSTSVLQISQFPPTLSDARGNFHKPESW